MVAGQSFNSVSEPSIPRDGPGPVLADEGETQPLTRQWNIKMPVELADRIDAAARERVVGRELFLTKLLTEAMDALVPMERITRLPGRGFAAPLAPVDVDAQRQRQVDDAQRGPL